MGAAWHRRKEASWWQRQRTRGKALAA